MSSSSPKVRIVTLGCAKNEVDSEEIAGVLAENGYHIDARSRAPEITIINTCGFLESSKQESIEAIKKAVRSKGNGKVIVAGCLSQRLGAELTQIAPGADAYIGVGQMNRFGDIVSEALATPQQIIDIKPPHHRWAKEETRARTGKPWSAYLKISEGCDHQCTFCTIPSFRGKHVSKPIERVLSEASYLASTGAKEVNLIAQDVTQYGYDLYRSFTLPKLLKELNKVDGIKWIRMLYFYPNRLTDEVIESMATLEHVVPYIDIPFQHVHPDTLRRMKRPWDGTRYLSLIEKVRKAIPEVAIRTTYIVGFPGETEEEFKYLLEFARASKLDRVGAFMYSRESGTPSYDMPNQIPFRIKKERYERLMRTQQQISLDSNRNWVGKTIKVLVDDMSPEGSIGRSYRDAPEIDGSVLFAGDGVPGSFQDVLVTDATEYDLHGTQRGVSTTAPKLLQIQRRRTRAPL